MQKYHWLGGGLWIIPLLTFIGGTIFLITAYKASRSGSTQQTQTGIQSSDQNVPIYKIGQFKFAMALYAAVIGELILMYADR